MLLQQLPLGVFRTTPEGKIDEANAALANMLGYNLAELKKIDINKLYVKPYERRQYLKKIEDKEMNSYEFRLRRRDGRTIWTRSYPRPIKGPHGRIAYYDGILVDITREKTVEGKLKKVLSKLRESNRERQQMIQKLKDSSIRDDLTGLYNRRGFYMFAREYLSLANRKKNTMFLLFMDIDDLKKINDTFGHHIGDAALVKLAEILKSTFRSSDIKGRMGGDEFSVFPMDSSQAGVEIAMNRLKENIEALNSSGETPFKLSVSMGVACYDPQYPATLDELLVRADKLMYEQKRQK
jgi:diguanylate cyclase (GGDEF)-like protein/PAS domain S-box-containing protein